MNTKINWYIVMIIVILIIGIVSIIFANNLFEQNEDSVKTFYCISLKLGVVNGLLEDLERQEEHKELCATKECINSFDSRINKSVENLNEILEYDCSEK